MAQAQVANHHTTPQHPGITQEAYLEAYHQHPIEVVSGEIVMMSPPEFKHVRIAHGLFRSLDRFVIDRQLGNVFMEVPYVLDPQKKGGWVRGSRVPDVSYVARERLGTYLSEYGESGPLRLAPNLAVEIVSPNDAYTRVNRKVVDYLRYGVLLVWVIDPSDRVVRIHTPQTPDGFTLDENAILPADPVLPGWLMPVKEILDGKPEV